MHARKVPSFVLQRQHSFPSRASSFAHSPSQSQRKTHDQTLDSGYVEVTQTTGYRAALQFKIRRLLQSEYFERFMLLFIIVNCILLGFESNHPAFQDSRLGQSLQILEFVFLSIFSIEMTLKIIAFGFLMAPGSYLRDGIATNHSCSLTSFSSGWNVLDFTVIVLGWVAFSPSVGNYSALRAVRVLRSLRTITGIPGMRVRNPSIVLKTLSLCVQKLVLTLLQSLPMLLDVGILCAFAYFVFGIIGVQLFSGALDNQCGCPLLEGSSFGNGSLSQVCRGRYSDEIHWTIVDGKLYGENEHSDLVESYHCSTRVTEDCPNGLLCAHTGNPNYGITNFDNILSSWLTIFQIISMEGWTTIMYQVQDAVGQISWVYFFILIITGSLFAVNLALAVLYLHFTNSESKSEDEEVSSGCSMRSTIGSSSDSHSLELPFEDKNWLRKQCTKIRQSEVVESLTMFLIVFNVVVMAAEHHGMPSWQQSLSEYTNTVVAIYFFIEMIVKIISFGWFNFIADKSNLFDGVIAVAGLIELVISSLTNGSGLRGSIYVLRVFRLLRIFKLSRSWRELNKIVSTVHGSVSSMANLVLIFFLFIMIMALLGMQLFGFKLHSCQVPEAVSICPPGIVDNLRKTGHCDCYVPCQASQKGTWISIYDSVYNHQGYCEEFPREASESTTPEFWAQVGPAIVPRHNFDDFFMASLTVFQILTGENWNEVLYDLIHSTSYFAAIYCGVVILIGNYILLNLFLAILLDNFAGTNGTNDSDEMQLVDESKEEDASSTVSFSSTQDVHIETSKVTENQDYVEEESRLVGYSLFLFSPTNQLRVALDRVVSHWLFEYVIMVIIFFSSVMLILESPEPRDGTPLADFVYIGDRVLNLLFGMEALMKIIVLGFCFNGPRSYLRDYWNVLDFVILIIGVYFVSNLVISDSFESLRALRALRGLRPLRLARRTKGIRVVINSLFQSIPPLLNVALVCLLFFLTFGILGVSLFKGRFYFCADENGNRINSDSIGQDIDRDWCIQGYHMIDSSAYHNSINVTIPTYTLNHNWKRSVLNFDNIGSAMLTLFEMSTLEMWLDVMYNGIDAVGVDQQPTRDYNRPVAIFFMSFIIIGAFFVLNLFVTVTIDKFHEIKERQEGRSYLLSLEQEDWVIMQRFLWVAKPIRRYGPSKNSRRRQLFNVVNSSAFEYLVTFAILFNVLAMALTHHNMNTQLENGIDVVNSICTLFFTMEVIIKIIALGPSNYFRVRTILFCLWKSVMFQDRWNVFDFVVTGVSLAGSPLWSAPNIPLMSVFRVVRLLRLMPRATGLRMMFQTLAFSFPALFNVGGVLSLFFFIYAIMGVQLFHGAQRGTFLNRHANFDHFPRALLTLFRMSTGESWNGIMHDLMAERDCILLSANYTSSQTFLAGTYFSSGDPELDLIPGDRLEDHCNPHAFVTILYFVSFILICGFILLNVVIAVILDNFQSSLRIEHLPVQVHHIEEFSKVWSELDPDATGYIPTEKLPILILELSPPLGPKGTDLGMAEILTVILSLDIPDRNNHVHFLETLHSLMGQIAGTRLPLEEDYRIHEHMFHRLPSKRTESNCTAAHFHSAKYVQASIRGFLIRERITTMIQDRDFEGLAQLRQKKTL